MLNIADPYSGFLTPAIPYELALKRQATISELGFLLFRPEPILTFGKRQWATNISTENITALGLRETLERFEELNIPHLKTDRGGLTALHGPWQLLLFPTGSLDGWMEFLKQKNLKPSPRVLVEMLQGGILNLIQTLTGAKFKQILLKCPAAESGIYFYEPTAQQYRKIVYFGFRIKKSGFSHGIAINLWEEVKLFQSIIPCGDVTAAPALGLKEGLGDASVFEIFKLLGVDSGQPIQHVALNSLTRFF